MEEAIKLLEKYKQEKIIKELEKSKNPELIKQTLNIDFEKIERCKEKIGKETEYKEDKIESISYIDGSKMSEEEKEEYEKIGIDVISKVKYAVVTMAGGQRNKTRSHWSKRNIFIRC